MQTNALIELSISHKMHLDGVRRALIRPSSMKMNERNDLASAIITEMLYPNSKAFKDSIDKILRTIREDKNWDRTRRIALSNDAMFSLVFTDIFNSVTDNSDLNNSMTDSVSKFESIIELLGLLESVYPYSDFDDVTETITMHLLSSSLYLRMYERREVIEWIAEIMRHAESELVYEKTEKNSVRPLIIAVDSSKEMRGEAEIVSKAMILALSRRLLSANVCVKIVFNDDDIISFIPDARPVDQFLELITRTFGDGTNADTMLRRALSSMKQGNWENSDLVLISKGIGMKNNISFTREWETYKTFRKMRIFSIAAADHTVRGITELSDQTYEISDKTITEKRGEYARLVRDISTL